MSTRKVSEKLTNILIFLMMALLSLVIPLSCKGAPKDSEIIVKKNDGTNTVVLEKPIAALLLARLVMQGEKNGMLYSFHIPFRQSKDILGKHQLSGDMSSFVITIQKGGKIIDKSRNGHLEITHFKNNKTPFAAGRFEAYMRNEKLAGTFHIKINESLSVLSQ